jgi:hypothetical protein
LSQPEPLRPNRKPVYAPGEPGTDVAASQI